MHNWRRRGGKVTSKKKEKRNPILLCDPQFSGILSYIVLLIVGVDNSNIPDAI